MTIVVLDTNPRWWRRAKVLRAMNSARTAFWQAWHATVITRNPVPEGYSSVMPVGSSGGGSTANSRFGGATGFPLVVFR